MVHKEGNVIKSQYLIALKQQENSCDRKLAQLEPNTQ